MTGEQCRFRPEADGDAEWLDARLPRDRRRGRTFVGVSGERRIAGFAIAPPLEHYEPAGLAVALHAEADADAVGHHVVTLAATMAAAMGVGPLHAWPHPAEGSAAAALFGRLGFATFDARTAYEVDVRKAASQLAPLVAFQASRGPSPIIVRPLREVDAGAVLAVWERGLGSRGGLRDAHLKRLRGEGAGAFDLDLSFISTLQDRTVGVYLVVDLGGGAARADVVAIDRDARTSGSVLELLGPVVAAGLARGFRSLRWDAMNDARFAHRLARRLDARTLDRHLAMRRDPPSGAPTASFAPPA